MPRTCSWLIPTCTIAEHKLLRPWAFPVVEEQPGAGAEAVATSSAASGPGSEPSPLCPGTEGEPGMEEAGTERGYGQIEGGTRGNREGNEAGLGRAQRRRPDPGRVGAARAASVPGAGSGCAFVRSSGGTRRLAKRTARTTLLSVSSC